MKKVEKKMMPMKGRKGLNGKIPEGTLPKKVLKKKK